MDEALKEETLQDEVAARKTAGEEVQTDGCADLPLPVRQLAQFLMDATIDGKPLCNLPSINSALLKLSKLAKPAMVYRSVPGGVLPQHFWRPDQRHVTREERE